MQAVLREGEMRWRWPAKGDGFSFQDEWNLSPCPRSAARGSSLFSPARPRTPACLRQTARKTCAYACRGKGRGKHAEKQRRDDKRGIRKTERLSLSLSSLPPRAGLRLREEC